MTTDIAAKDLPEADFVACPECGTFSELYCLMFRRPCPRCGRGRVPMKSERIVVTTDPYVAHARLEAMRSPEPEDDHV